MALTLSIATIVTTTKSWPSTNIGFGLLLALFFASSLPRIPSALNLLSACSRALFGCKVAVSAESVGSVYRSSLQRWVYLPLCLSVDFVWMG